MRVVSQHSIHIVLLQNVFKMSREVYILDYGCGNMGCISNAVSFCKHKPLLTSIKDYKEINPLGCQVILPGVGNFEYASRIIHASIDLGEFCTWVRATSNFIGICLGFQLLFRNSTEVLSSSSCSPAIGLGLIDAAVVECKNNEFSRSLNIGWRQSHVILSQQSKNINAAEAKALDRQYYYHMHSYGVRSNNSQALYMCDWHATSKHLISGDEYVSAIRMENIVGMQFHPEKSGQAGLELLATILTR